jgi:hypothetical protein
MGCIMCIPVTKLAYHSKNSEFKKSFNLFQINNQQHSYTRSLDWHNIVWMSLTGKKWESYKIENPDQFAVDLSNNDDDSNDSNEDDDAGIEQDEIEIKCDEISPQSNIAENALVFKIRSVLLEHFLER